jgi:hypothetical protein
MMNGRTFNSQSYEDPVIADLDEVEDYSSDSIIGANQQQQQQYPQHDQLPHVEEVRQYAGGGTRTTLKSRRGGWRSSFKLAILVLGVCLVIVGVMGHWRNGTADGSGATVASTTTSTTLNTTEAPDEDEAEVEENYFHIRPPQLQRTSMGGSAESLMSVEDYEELITGFALNPISDFSNKYSYQSLARRWLLKDSDILLNATHPEIEQRYALYCLLLATDAVMWMPSKNIPECGWDGVTCETYEGDCSHDSRLVTRLNLRNVQMQGDLPNEILLLKHLEVLNLNANPNLKSIPEGLCDRDGLEIKADCDRLPCTCCSECGNE